jgi:hypothetical protein
MTLFDLLLVITGLGTCIRLLVYRREQAAYKALVSLIAYLLIVAYGVLSLAILTGITNSKQIPYALIIAIFMLSTAVFYCAGNVSTIIKLPWRIQHDINIRQ